MSQEHSDEEPQQKSEPITGPTLRQKSPKEMKEEIQKNGKGLDPSQLGFSVELSRAGKEAPPQIKRVPATKVRRPAETEASFRPAKPGPLPRDPPMFSFEDLPAAEYVEKVKRAGEIARLREAVDEAFVFGVVAGVGIAITSWIIGSYVWQLCQGAGSSPIDQEIVAKLAMKAAKGKAALLEE